MSTHFVLSYMQERRQFARSKIGLTRLVVLRCVVDKIVAIASNAATESCDSCIGGIKSGNNI
jgi:hypothetical protein